MINFCHSAIDAESILSIVDAETTHRQAQ